MLARVLASLGLVLLGACAHARSALSETRPPAPIVSPACTEAAAGPQSNLCATVKEIVVQSGRYIDDYDNNTETRAALQVLAFASAVATSGFVVFDAHLDNIKGATLTTGALMLANNGLRLNERVDVQSDGVSSMGCYAAIANTFAAALGPEGDATKTQGLITELGASLVASRARAATGVARGAEAAREREALNAAIRRGESAYENLLKARRAFDAANSEIERSFHEAHALINDRLRGLRPDLTRLVADAQALSEAINQPAPPAAGAARDAAHGVAGSPPRRVTDASLTAELNRLLVDADAINASHYIGEFQRIASCKALAAA